MGASIRARVKGRSSLELSEPTDLPVGTEVMVTIASIPEEPDVEAFRRAAGSWEGLIDADKLIEDIYADRLISTREAPKL